MTDDEKSGKLITSSIDNKGSKNLFLESTIENIKTDEEIIQESPRKLGLKLKDMRQRLNLTLDSSYSSRNTSMDYSTLSETSSFDSLDTSIVSMKSKTPDSTFEKYYKTFRDDVIRKELKLLSQHHQDGVFVMPSMTSLQVWFGVIFIRDGPYKDGIFHFTVYFKDDFPESIPIIRFKDRVFHPQIEIRKGTFNTRIETTKRIHVWQLLKHLRSSFYHLDIQKGTNEMAAAIFKSNNDEFLKRCRKSALDSLYAFEEQRYESDNVIENPFKSCLVEDSFQKGFVKFLVANANNQNGTPMASAIGWAKNQLGRVLNNLNTSFNFVEEE